MNRRRLALGLVALALAPGIARADAADAIVARLRAQGYTRIEVTRTFLGRVRIVAESDNARREIVLNPRTGEILRDFREETVAGNSGSPEHSGGGGDGADDNDGDDDDDDGNDGEDDDEEEDEDDDEDGGGDGDGD